MGDDLSHSPYVSGNSMALARPNVSNVRFGKSGVVGQSVMGLRRVGACRMQPHTELWVAFFSALPGPRVRRTTIDCAFLC
jgi:hypothetical protein